MNDKSDATAQNLLTQYTLYVHMANKISQSREASNRFYVTLITSPGLILLLITQISPNTPIPPLMPALIGAIGIVISLTWLFSIQSYKKINEAKFSVILDIEKKLPYPGFTKEWGYLKGGKHADLTSTEKLIPWTAGACYMLLIIFSLTLPYLTVQQ